MLLAPLVLAACQPDFGTDVSGGILGHGLLDVFPNAALVQDGHLDIPADALPVSPSPAPVERVAWRSGFSPIQPSVVQITGVDPAVLPKWRTPTPGEGAVLLVDLDSGEFLPVMAEIDAYPVDNPDPVLIVRPLIAVPYGHTVAVVLTTEAVARPERFDALVDGKPPEDFGGGAQHLRELMDRLEVLGIERDEVALAWDYPIGDGTVPLRSALAQLQPPGTWSFHRIRNKDEGDTVGLGAWRVADGHFQVQNYLVDDEVLDLNADGSVTSTGIADAELYVHVPESVKDAPAGTVPVLVVGHGIFGQPADFIDVSYSTSPLYLSDELGMIIVATRWRGLDYKDLPVALGVANDFGKIPTLTDKMIQGQVNARTMIELLARDLITSDPVFLGAQGQKLVDPDRIVFEGLSLGSIQGAVLIANDAPIEAGVLHIGGAGFSTLLERSSQWSFMERFVVPAIPDPQDRQQLYSLSQLFWDPVDPLSYADDLRDRELLLQMNIGDNSVCNLGSTMLARSIDLPLLEPAVTEAQGITSVAAPLPAGSRAWVQFDPGVGEPADENRPSADTGAHGATEAWPGVRLQMKDFLTPGQEGTVVHHCGDGPCTDENRGTLPD